MDGNLHVYIFFYPYLPICLSIHASVVPTCMKQERLTHVIWHTWTQFWWFHPKLGASIFANVYSLNPQPSDACVNHNCWWSNPDFLMMDCCPFSVGYLHWWFRQIFASIQGEIGWNIQHNMYIYIRIYTHTAKNTCLQLLPLWTPHVVHLFYNYQCFPIKSPTKHPHLLLVWLFSFWLLQNPAWCFNSNGCSGNPLFCDVTFSTFFSMKSPIQWP